MKLKMLLTSAGIVAMGATAQAAEVELAFSHWVSAQHPVHVGGIEPWVQSISDASQGRIKINVFPAAQLGAAADHYDMARDAIVDIAFVNPGYQPGRFPVISAGEIPFTISNATKGSQAFDEWYREYAEAEMKDVHFCMVHQHDPGTLHGTKGPLQVPADLKGKNIRPAHGTMARMLNHAGAASVFAGAAEMRELLARGAAEITASPWSSIYTFGVNDLAKHHLDMPFYGTTFTFVMNKAMVEGLSPENRAVIDDHCSSEWAGKIPTKWVEDDVVGRQRMIDDGHTLYKPTADEVNLWIEATSPLRDEWKEAVAKTGVDAEAAWARLDETLVKYDSQVK
jgi:TRAP-type C4-dicarboxylate transport system substrate-binding protein